MLGSKKKSDSLSQGEVISKITKSLKHLIGVIEQENLALKEGQISSINMVVEKKIDAISKFSEAENDIEKYAKSGGKFDQNSSPLVKLKELFTELNVVKKDNEVLIKSNLEVSDLIMEMYKENKMQETIRQYCYDKEGSISSEKVKNYVPSAGLNNRV